MRLSVLFLLMAAMVTAATADPRLWGPHGRVLFPLGGVEWNRAVARDDLGNTLVLWSDMHSQSRDIYAQFVGQDGTPLWADNGVPVTNDMAEQSLPVAIAVNDGWIIAWMDYRLHSRDVGGDIWMQKLDGSGHPTWDANGILVDSSTGLARGSIHLAPDGMGGAIVAWSMPWSISRAFAQHVNGYGEFQWPGPLQIANNLVDGGAFCSAADGSGGMIVAWQTSAENSDIRVSRVAWDGERQWGNSILVAGGFPEQVNPALCSDGSGGCFIAWSSQDSVNGTLNWNIRAQWLNSLAQRMWEAGGILLSDAPEYDVQTVSLAASKAYGTTDGCLFAWSEERSPSAHSYLAQKVDPGGTLLWGTSGALLTDSAWWYWPPKVGFDIQSDGEGGIVAAWENTPTGSAGSDRIDVCVERLGSGGQTVWPQAHVRVISDGGDQKLPAVVTQADGFVVTFGVQNQVEGLQGIDCQKLGRSTGARLLPENGERIVDRGPYHDPRGTMGVPMSDNRTALIQTKLYDGHRTVILRILNSEGQLEYGIDSVITRDDSELYYPALETTCDDGSGGFFLVFGSGGGEAYSRRYLMHVNSAGHVVNPVPVPVWQEDGDYNIENTALSSDSSGGCYVAFYEAPPQRMGLHVMRVDSSCQHLWNSPVQLDSLYVQIAGISANPDGGCTVAWKSFHTIWPEQIADYWLARVSMDRELLWRTQICDTSTQCDSPAMVADGQGGSYCAWSDDRPAPGHYYHVYAQHVSIQGVNLWPQNGVPVGNLANIQSAPQIMPGDAGSLLVVWSNLDTLAEELTAHAQKMTPGGERLWGDNGLEVSPSGYSYLGVTDGMGGLFLIWVQDEASLLTRIYGTHVNGDGTFGPDPYWLPNGQRLISDAASGISQFISITRGAPGNAVLLWIRDYGQSDEPWLYLVAQRITAMSSTARKPNATVVQQYALHQNFPNPFNPATQITFDLPQSGMTRLTVYDLLGRRVASLVDRALAAGEHRINFDASHLSSGIYFYRLQSGTFVSSRKMILLR